MKRISVALFLLLAVGLVGCKTTEQKAQEQAQAQAQKAEAERAQQAAEAARKLREELGDAIVVNVKHWGRAGAVPPNEYKTIEQGIGFKITSPQMFVKRSTGMVTIVFDSQLYGKTVSQFGGPVKFIVRLFDENGQHITHFTTEERFASPTWYHEFEGSGMTLIRVKAEHNVAQYRINRRDAEYIQKGEFGFIFG
ncbi:MAG TPA: hypothetical protein VIX91_19705 [Candidatus Acidoferrum sp.]